MAWRGVLLMRSPGPTSSALSSMPTRPPLAIPPVAETLTPEEVQEDLRYVWVPLCSRSVRQPADGLIKGQGLAVWTVRGHGIEGIHHADNAGQERYLLP